MYMGTNEKLRIRPKLMKKNLIPKNEAEAAEFRRTTDLLISTPSKLGKAIEGADIGLKKLKCLIIDEADKLFEIEAIPHLDKILTYINENCTSIQKAIFSATMQPNIEELIKTVLSDPVKVIVGVKNAAVSSVEQKLVYAGNEQGKLIALRAVFKEGFKPPMLIFAQSKKRAKELFFELLYDGVNVNMIHAGMDLHSREEIVNKFRLGEIWVLICSDLISRGIDFKGVNYVVNYDFPQSIVNYIHRIGRTGRAGTVGKALTFVTADDVEMLRPIANLMKKSVFICYLYLFIGVRYSSVDVGIKASNKKEKKGTRKASSKKKENYN